jgi:hypothetical protein
LLLATAVITGLLIPHYINGNQSKASQPQTALSTLSDTSTISQIKQAISEISIKYNLNEAGLARLIKCESSFNHNQYGDSGRAWGILQFHKPTFEHFCKGDYKNIKDQLECGARMISEGLGFHWTCMKNYLTN